MVHLFGILGNKKGLIQFEVDCFFVFGLNQANARFDSTDRFSGGFYFEENDLISGIIGDGEGILLKLIVEIDGVMGEGEDGEHKGI